MPRTTGCPSTSPLAAGQADRVRRHERPVVQRLALVQRRLGRRRRHHGHRLVGPVERLGRARQGGRSASRPGMQDLHTVLHPGESHPQPAHPAAPLAGRRRRCGPTTSSAARCSRHILPRIDGQLVVPPIAHLSTSFYELNDSHRGRTCSPTWSRSGAWASRCSGSTPTGPARAASRTAWATTASRIERVEPQDRFPRGLRPIGEAVHAGGPGVPDVVRAGAGARRARSSPRSTPSGSSRPRGDGSGLFNLGIPEAREYMTDYLNAAIKAYRLSTACASTTTSTRCRSGSFLDAKDPNRVGMAEIRYVEGLYRMWDDILRGQPAPVHRQLRQRRPADRPGDLLALDPALAQRQHLRHARPQAGDRARRPRSRTR